MGNAGCKPLNLPRRSKVVKIPKKQTSPLSISFTHHHTRRQKEVRERRKKEKRKGGRKGEKIPRKGLLAFEGKHELPGSKRSRFFSFYSSTVLFSLSFLPPSFWTFSPSASDSRKKKIKISSNNMMLREEGRITAAQEKKKDEMRKPERRKNIIIRGAPGETRELLAPNPEMG